MIILACNNIGICKELKTDFGTFMLSKSFPTLSALLHILSNPLSFFVIDQRYYSTDMSEFMRKSVVPIPLD